jgi:mannan polymerase II complex MNN10 subunit
MGISKAKSDEVNGYPAFSIRNNGFFARHARSISGSLPRFNLGGRRDYAEKEKLGRGRWHEQWKQTWEIADFAEGFCGV